MALSKSNIYKIRAVIEDLKHLERLVRPYDPQASEDLERGRQVLEHPDSHLTHAIAEQPDE